jgi:hypothetical protein
MTTTIQEDIRLALDNAVPGHHEPGMAQIKHGTAHSVIKAVFASLSAAAAVDVTTAASKSKATVSGVLLASGENLPAIGSILALRVTAGSATAGARITTDAGGTAGAPGANGPGIALVSDDGKTLTFEATVTGFVLEYTPRAAVAMTTPNAIAG